ncbi:MAG: hypothetical protein RLZZ342_343 [Candidatus Parcubacteria bacterium]|jgi:hypothetical protein
MKYLGSIPSLSYRQWSLIGITVLAAGTSLFVSIIPKRDAELDALLARSIELHANVASYEQHVETEAAFPGRGLSIQGIYRVDRLRGRYEGISTTTLSFPGGPKNIAFSLHNTAIGRFVYVHVHTSSPVLKGTIPATDTWQRFSADAIPETYQGIAVPGPILDNLRILNTVGTYIVQNNYPERTQEGDRKLARYTFTAHSVTEEPGTLQALLSHIQNGIVVVWIDIETAKPVRLAFHAPSYHSTTTLSRIGEDVSIEAPVEILR